MQSLAVRLTAAFAAAALGACAATAPAPSGTVEMRLLPGQSPVAGIEGPYAAYSRVGHGVLVRVWPDSIRGGVVDLSVVVQNTDLEPLSLTLADIAANGEGGPLEVLGAAAMLARVDARGGRRIRETAELGNVAALGSESVYDGNAYDGVIAVSTPTDGGAPSAGRQAPADRAAQRQQVANWYLDTLRVEPGETASSGLGLALPASSQSIILSIEVGGEEHEFALVFATRP